MPRIDPAYHLDDPATDIYVGDNREVLAQIPDGSVDLVFADPPFNWDVNYGVWKDDMPRDDYLKFTREWIDACLRVLAPHGSIWINIPDDTAAEIVVHLKERKMAMINWCIWHFRFGQCRNANFIVSKVHVLYFAKNPTSRIWNPDAILEPSDRATMYADARTRNTQTPGLRVPLDVWYGPYWGRVQGNNKERRANHENQIPEVYMDRVIRACSREDSLVLDPFLGSGTTCTMARALGRRSIGIEVSPTIAKSAFDRVKRGPVRLNNSFESAILRAFFSIHEGESTEEVIVNDRLRDRFLKACAEELEKHALPAQDEFTCNWTLEALRKAGKLGRVSSSRRKAFGVRGVNADHIKEIADKLVSECHATIDRTMCDPVLRQEFDESVRRTAPDVDVYLVRKAALVFRKNPKRRRSVRDGQRAPNVTDESVES